MRIYRHAGLSPCRFITMGVYCHACLSPCGFIAMRVYPHVANPHGNKPAWWLITNQGTTASFSNLKVLTFVCKTGS